MKPQFILQHIDKRTDIPLFPPYTLERFSFLFVLEGEVLNEIDGKTFLVGPGQFLLCQPRKTVAIKHLKECIGYEGSFPESFLKDASYPVLRADTPVHQTFWFDDGVFMGALLKRMLDALEHRDFAFLHSALDLILCQLKPMTSTSVLPETFLKMVFGREQPILSVSDYARMLEVSPNYLNKTVKAHTHKTAMEWIEISRLNLSKQMLKDRRYSIQEIAVRTGLDDQSYFSRFFKKKTGLSPSEYRNQVTSGNF